MKHLTFIIFLLFAILTTARAQELTDSQKQFLDGDNILKNGGFEAGRANWTSTTVTPTSSTSTVIKGSRSLCFTASSQAFTLLQDSTKYAAAFADGIQGLLKVRIRSNHTGAITVCSRQAGTTSTTNCVTVNASTLWGLYKIPFLLGATSNGISISAASGTGTTCIDDASVSAQDIKQDINVVGPWQSYTPTFTGFGTVALSEFQWRQNGENIEVRGKVTAGTPTAVEGRVSLPTGYTSSGTTKIPSIQLAGLGSVSYVTPSSVNVLIEPSVAYFTFGVQNSTNAGLTKSNGSNVLGGGNTLSFQASVPVTSFQGASSVYSSTNADTNFAPCTFSTQAWTGFGTVTTTNLRCRRNGSNLDIVGTFTMGTGTASTAQFLLPTWGGVQLTTATSAAIPTLSPAGTWLRTVSAANHGGHVLMNSSLGYLTFTGANVYSGNTLVPLNSEIGTSIGANNELFGVNISVPISGWENSNVIIGTFKDAVTSQGSNSADIQSVYFGSGATCSTSCTTGTCVICNPVGTKITSVTFSATGIYNINGIDGTKYNCSGTGINPGVAPIHIAHDRVNSSSSLAKVNAYNNSGALANTGYASVTCIGIP